MDRLVKQLTTGKHNVILEPHAKTLEEIKKRISELKFVFIRFTETQGGTELGLKIDPNKNDISEEDFDLEKGKICLVGSCELNYHQVLCHTEIDLKTRRGTAQLECVTDTN